MMDTKKIIFYTCLVLIMGQSYVCIALHDELIESKTTAGNVDKGFVKFAYVIAMMSLAMALTTVVFSVMGERNNCFAIQHLGEFLLPGILIVISSFSLAFYTRIDKNHRDSGKMKAFLAVSIIFLILGCLFFILQVMHRSDKHLGTSLGQKTGLSKLGLSYGNRRPPPTRPNLPANVPVTKAATKPSQFGRSKTVGGLNTTLNEVYKMYPHMKN